MARVWADTTVLSTHTIKPWHLTHSKDWKHTQSNASSLIYNRHYIWYSIFSHEFFLAKSHTEEIQIFVWVPHLTFIKSFTMLSSSNSKSWKEFFQEYLFLYINLYFPQVIVIHTVKGFGIVNKAEIDVFLELSCFFNDPAVLAIWSLVPLPFLKPAWTSGSSRFTYSWSLAWKILSITLLVCEMSVIVQ